MDKWFGEEVKQKIYWEKIKPPNRFVGSYDFAVQLLATKSFTSGWAFFLI